VELMEFRRRGFRYGGPRRPSWRQPKVRRAGVALDWRRLRDHRGAAAGAGADHHPTGGTDFGEGCVVWGKTRPCSISSGVPSRLRQVGVTMTDTLHKLPACRRDLLRNTSPSATPGLVIYSNSVSRRAAIELRGPAPVGARRGQSRTRPRVMVFIFPNCPGQPLCR